MVVKKSQSATHLGKDSKVEVCSNEDGFKGAWFPAKINRSKPLNPATKKKRKSFSDGSSNSFSPTKAEVQYETLLFRRWGSCTRLICLWCGGPNCVLTGIWRTAFGSEPKRSPGTAVEMNPDEERLFYAWFPAIYLGQLGIDSFLLQYKKSNNSDVKIIVRGHQIRPQPPNSTERDFSLLDKVDAFHGMGWWVGDITKVLKGNKYAVTLSCTKQEMEFSLLELKTHMDWNDGGWATMSHGRRITEVREFHFRRGSEAQSKHSCRSSKSDYKLQSCSRIPLKIQSKHLSPCTDKSPYGGTKKKLKMSPQSKDGATILSHYKKLKGGHSEDSLSLEKSFPRRTPVKSLNKESPVINVLARKPVKSKRLVK